MIIDGEKLIISLNMKLDEVSELHAFIKTRVKYIDEIISDEADSKIETLALLQLLMSIKKSKPEMIIPLLDAKKYSDPELGTLHWNDLWI